MLESILVALSMATATAAPGPTTDLVVKIDGFLDSSGWAVLKIHDSTASMFRDPPYRELRSRIHAGACRFEIPAIASGRWAFFAYHDRNANGTVDHGWMRFPIEPMAFSNLFRPGLLAGMPNYHKLAVAVRAPADTILLRVR